MAAFLMNVGTTVMASEFDKFRFGALNEDSNGFQSVTFDDGKKPPVIVLHQDQIIVLAKDQNLATANEAAQILSFAQDKGEIAENLTNQRNCAGSALGSILFGSALYARNICSNGVSSVVGAASAVALNSFLSRKAPNSAEYLLLAGGVGLVTYGYNKWIIGEPRDKDNSNNA